MHADTNAVLSALLPQRVHHALAQEIIRANRPVIVGESVLAEACWALERSYEIPRRDVAVILREALESGEFRAWNPELAAFAVELMEAKPQLAFVDCILAARAAYGEEVLTFDRALARAIESI